MAYSAKNITVLEGLQPVRERPGMYIGSTSVKGLNHLVYEILDNSVDEHLAGYCNKITVTLRKDGSVTIEDNGRGIPVDLHDKGYPAERVIMTTLHAGGKFDNSAYKTSGGLHGVGASVVNALSSKMVVEIKKDETIAATAKIGEKISVRRFTRYERGEGIEKKESNLAAEIAEMTKK